jgi:hypothetical protein
VAGGFVIVIWARLAANPLALDDMGYVRPSRSHPKRPLTTPNVKFGPHRGDPPGAEPAAAADRCHYNICLCGPVGAWAPRGCPPGVVQFGGCDARLRHRGVSLRPAPRASRAAADGPGKMLSIVGESLPGVTPVSRQLQPDQTSRHAERLGAFTADVMRRLCPQRGDWRSRCSCKASSSGALRHRSSADMAGDAATLGSLGAGQVREPAPAPPKCRQ